MVELLVCIAWWAGVGIMADACHNSHAYVVFRIQHNSSTTVCTVVMVHLIIPNWMLCDSTTI